MLVLMFHRLLIAVTEDGGCLILVVVVVVVRNLLPGLGLGFFNAIMMMK